MRASPPPSTTTSLQLLLLPLLLLLLLYHANINQFYLASFLISVGPASTLKGSISCIDPIRLISDHQRPGMKSMSTGRET